MPTSTIFPPVQERDPVLHRRLLADGIRDVAMMVSTPAGTTETTKDLAVSDANWLPLPGAATTLEILCPLIFSTMVELEVAITDAGLLGIRILVDNLVIRDVALPLQPGFLLELNQPLTQATGPATSHGIGKAVLDVQVNATVLGNFTVKKGSFLNYTTVPNRSEWQ